MGIKFSKNIGMGSRVKQKKGQFCVVLLPEQQPVRLNVTFPNASVFAREDMGPVLCGECPSLGQQTHHRLEIGDIQSTTLAELVGFFETTGVVNRVLHASNCAIKSSTLLASYTRPASTSSKACCRPLLRGFLIVHPILRDRLRAKRNSLRGTSK